MEPLPPEPAADHAAPHGVYGVGTSPLSKGEVWVQDAEVLYLSAQAGLGRGWDVGVAFAGVPYQQLVGGEVGYAASFGAWDVRGLAGGYAAVVTEFHGPTRAVPGVLVGVGAGTGARGRRFQGSLRVNFGSQTVLFPEVDVNWTLGKHTAILGGLAGISAPENNYLTFLAGPALRLFWGGFSLDIGVQAVFGPSVHLGDPPPGGSGLGVLPAPTLAFRYGFGPAKPAPPAENPGGG